MSTKKLQVLDYKIKQAENADTIDGKHALDFATATDMGAAQSSISDLQTKVGDTSVSDQIATGIANKVDKVDGKGLSTNDYTTAEKDKLAGIADGANKTTVDSALSSTSTNPVQNKVVTAAVNTATNFSDKIKRGINSIINSSDAISINPAVNGIGYSIARGATAIVRFDGFELPVIQKSMEALFDGKSSTYIRLQQIVSYVNVSEMAWSDSAQYHSGDFVVLREEDTNKVIMFKALQDNVGVNPIDNSDVWLDNYRDSTGTYSQAVVLRNITIQMEFRFPYFIDYENGFSLYFRSASQVVRNLVFETGLSDGSLWIVEKSINGNCNVVETIPTIGTIQNHRGEKKSIRLTFEPTTPETTWTAFTQICVTGLVGGIEGTLLNRGGGTLYGNVTPETDNAISLGSSTKQWNNVHSKVFTGNLSGNASTATKATQDSAGQQINTTYIKGLSASGKTVTYTKGDGTTGTITTQDTTYSNATTSAAGLMSSTDKAKLDGIATGATKVTVDSALSSSSTNPVQNKVVNTAISNLNTLVGDSPVSDQISTAISELREEILGGAW